LSWKSKIGKRIQRGRGASFFLKKKKQKQKQKQKKKQKQNHFKIISRSVNFSSNVIRFFTEKNKN